MKQRARVMTCFYNQSNPLIKQLGDLKISYATTESFLIKSLLRQAEDLIVFRVGNVENLKKRMNSIVNPTLEERCFIQSLCK